MNVKRIRNIITCSILIASFITPAYSVKASDGSKKVVETVTKDYFVTLKDDYKNKTINKFDDLPDELKAKIPKSIAYKKDGFEGVLYGIKFDLKAIESSKAVTYKPQGKTLVETTDTKYEKTKKPFGTLKAEFPSTLDVKLMNPYTGKYQSVAANKIGDRKKGKTITSYMNLISEGRWYKYDKRFNAAYGIMGNSKTRHGAYGGGAWTQDAWSLAPHSGNTTKVYLGAMYSPFSDEYLNFNRLNWEAYVSSSHLSRTGTKWIEDAPVDASWAASQVEGNSAIKANGLLVNDFGGNTKLTEAFGYSAGKGWYFKSETGGLNRYRRGMRLVYRVPFEQTTYTQKYGFEFSEPPKIDYATYSTWKITVTYDGIAHDMRTNNFNVSYVKFNPGTVIIPNDKTRVSQKTSVTFDIGYSIYPDLTRQASPKVTVYQGSTALWTGSVPVSAGSKTRRTVSLGSINYGEGHNVIKVVVNPSKSIKERVPKNANAYTDNSMESSVRGVKSDNCIIYANAPRRTKNDWSEEWSIITQKGTVATDSDGEKYAAIVERKEDKQNKAYTEQYRLTEVYFRSKYTKDNNVNDLPTKGEGWQKLTNGSVATIKAGYGFELIAKTVYTTNRNEGLSITETFGTPYSSTKYGEGFASFKMISPSIGETITPSAMSLTMSNGDGGSKICVLLEQTGKNGDWWNETKTFEIPNKETVQGLMERKVYTAESSKPGVYEISIATPAPTSISSFTGYEAESPVGGGSGMKPKLYDYINFQLEILGQDDIKSHIGN